MKIWKYELDAPITTHEIPYGAQVVHVAAQAGIPCIWAIVSPDNPRRSRTFRIVAIGEQLVDLDRFDYLGTIHIDEALPSGEFVGHVFEELVPAPSAS